MVSQYTCAPDHQHSAKEAAVGIAAKMASRSRHVCLFLGAGASCSAGLPDIARLKDKVVAELSPDDARLAGPILDGENLEGGLSHLRQIRSLLQDSTAEFDGLDASASERLDASICSAIIKALDDSGADLTPFNHVASWLAGVDYERPVEVFTVNYDLLMERGLEHARAAFFDGFVGSIQARFRTDLVESLESARSTVLPSSFVRLWKLHGSCNWVYAKIEGRQEVVRVGGPPEDGHAVAIYPSERKYDESRRVPFVVLMDRFRRALSEPETVTLVSGYSFGDQHLNETLFDAARHHPRSEVVALCHKVVPDVLSSMACEIRNLTVLAPASAIIGGRHGAWAEEGPATGVFEDGAFMLGDFARLASFLMGSTSAPDDAAQ